MSHVEHVSTRSRFAFSGSVHGNRATSLLFSASGETSFSEVECFIRERSRMRILPYIDQFLSAAEEQVKKCEKLGKLSVTVRKAR